ncbi:hypothetical protein MCC93_26660 [Morococcus cerebrosus]|uniref:Uncharacterized protein n=1 Tax=Morococcus cerebrosus TaxID=1056807 RepID=A0A0C1E282_9NEIS|nr:hypothetical protein MCC93_26660 [Morococcus cerebrosus]
MKFDQSLNIPKKLGADSFLHGHDDMGADSDSIKRSSENQLRFSDDLGFGFQVQH